ncbi:anti-sigma factor antagonist [bacterium]|nr:anti-sigma factor antagonist [bacterium]
MHYEVRRIGDVAVVEMSGELSSRYSPDIRRRIEAVTTPLDAPIVLDFARVVYIDSSGLGALILLQQQLAQRNQRMLLINLTPQVKRVFDKVNLHRILVVCPSLPEALFALKNKRVVMLISRGESRAFYEELLKVNHLAVQAAGDGETALSMLRAGPVDLFLVDVAGNREGIRRLLATKQREAELARIPTVVVLIEQNDQAALAGLGVSEFFHEPFEVDQFIDAIRRLA